MTAVPLDRFITSALVIRGQHHALNGIPCQDAVVTLHDETAIIGVVCDGVGSVPLSHFGAEIAAREVAQIVRRSLASGVASLLTTGFLSSLYLETHDRLMAVSQEVGLHPTQGVELFLSTTIQIVIVTAEEAMVLALGDGYLTWEGKTRSIESMVGRPKPDGLTLPPPLLGTAMWHNAGGRTLNEAAPEWSDFLRQEARGFYVVAYGPTTLVAHHGLALASDGLRFSDELVRPTTHRAGFPLISLLERYDPASLAIDAQLFNLCVATPGSEDPVPEQRAAALFDLLQSHPALDAQLTRLVATSGAPLPSTLSNYVRATLSSPADSDASRAVVAAGIIRLLSTTVTGYLQARLGIAVHTDLLPLWDDVGYVRITPIRE